VEGIYFRRTDQTYANIVDRGYIIQNSEGKPYRVIGAMIDITEGKQAEDTILHHYGIYKKPYIFLLRPQN
jgi:two-component system CheB/CheR fusion protein